MALWTNLFWAWLIKACDSGSVTALFSLFLLIWHQQTPRNLQTRHALQTLHMSISEMSSVPTYIKTKPTFFGFGWGTTEDSVAVIQSGSDECVYENLCSCEGWREAGIVFDMKECCLVDVLYVLFEGEGLMKNDTQVSNVREGECSPSIVREKLSKDFMWVFGPINK